MKKYHLKANHQSLVKISICLILTQLQISTSHASVSAELQTRYNQVKKIRKLQQSTSKGLKWAAISAAVVPVVGWFIGSATDPAQKAMTLSEAASTNYEAEQRIGLAMGVLNLVEDLELLGWNSASEINSAAATALLKMIPPGWSKSAFCRALRMINHRKRFFSVPGHEVQKQQALETSNQTEPIFETYTSPDYVAILQEEAMRIVQRSRS